MRFKARKIDTVDLTDAFGGNPFADVTEASIDEANHVIRNVAVLGRKESLNGYTYQDTAVDTLTKLTDNAKWYVNHPSKDEVKARDGVRDVRDWAGVFTGAHRSGDKVMANLHVRPSFWELAKDVATMKPAGIGNSINTRSKVYKGEDGKESIVDIEVLKSIDLVASAATTNNLFESMKFPEDNDETRNQEEGILKDMIDNREKNRKISDLLYEASDMIREILTKNQEQGLDERKKLIGSLLDDLEGEVGKILNSQAKKEYTKKEDEMDWKTITMEDLAKERPDILQLVRASIEDAERVGKMEKDLVALTTKLTELTTAHEAITKENTILKAQNTELQTKLDEFETTDKKTRKESLIVQILTEAKLPADAVSDVFRKDLMAKEEAEIREAVEDRKKIWFASSGKPKGVGLEFVPKQESAPQQDVKTKEQLEAAKGSFLATVG